MRQKSAGGKCPLERRAQNERFRVCTDLQQQFHIKNMHEFMFTGLLRSFLGEFYKFIAVIPHTV